MQKGASVNSPEIVAEVGERQIQWGMSRLAEIDKKEKNVTRQLARQEREESRVVVRRETSGDSKNRAARVKGTTSSDRGARPRKKSTPDNTTREEVGPKSLGKASL